MDVRLNNEVLAIDKQAKTFGSTIKTAHFFEICKSEFAQLKIMSRLLRNG
ncbi:MAG: hypothetical protein ACOX3H_01725 [Saccharofermentanales bacterium]